MQLLEQDHSLLLPNAPDIMARQARDSGDTPTPAPRPRAPLLSALGVFAVLLAIYHTTLLRTVVDQDSGELVSAAHVLGIAHPTGYPLWVLLGRVFDFLPVGGTSAYRVALLSAVCSAGAAALVTFVALGLVGQALPALAAGLAFGLWFPTWSQAVRAEVYGLTALLVALALLALRRWQRERSWPSAYWLSLACGFVSMHHRTAMLAVAPALLAAVALTRPRRAKTYLAAASMFLAPFVCYAYLPLRALARPPLNWTDPSTLQRFLDHVLATQYQHFAFSHSFAQMIAEGIELLPALLAPGTGLSVLLAAVALPLIGGGWWHWTRREPAVAGSLAVGGVLLCIWVLQWGETTDLKVFFLPLGEVLAICGALGLSALADFLAKQRVVRATVMLPAAAVCAVLLGANWARSDLSNVWEHRDRWVAALSQMEPNAIFVSDFDVPSFATLYLQNVEGLRKDVALLRAVRLPDDWYVNLIEDPELRRAAQESWAGAGREAAELHERTAWCAYYLARYFGKSRPLYCLHPPWTSISGPPYFVGLSEDLVHLESKPPDMLRPREAGAALAQFPAGISLVAFNLDRGEAGAGEMVGFTAQWRLSAALPPAQFAVGLVPENMSTAQFAQTQWENERLVQAFPVAHGQWGLRPSPEGTVYEQRGELIVPSNAASSGYRVAVGIGPPYASEYQGWLEVGKMRVRSRSLPRNGP